MPKVIMRTAQEWIDHFRESGMPIGSYNHNRTAQQIDEIKADALEWAADELEVAGFHLEDGVRNILVRRYRAEAEKLNRVHPAAPH